jgi:hypothetical protein
VAKLQLRLLAATKVNTLIAEDDEQLFAGAEDNAIYSWRLNREHQRLDQVAALTVHDGPAGRIARAGEGHALLRIAGDSSTLPPLPWLRPKSTARGPRLASMEHEVIQKPQDGRDPGVPRPEDGRGDGLVKRTSRSTTVEGGDAVLAGEVALEIGGDVSVEEQEAGWRRRCPFRRGGAGDWR